MKVQRSILVTFNRDLNLIGAFLMIVSFFPTAKFIEQFGILVIPISNFLDGTINVL